MSSPRTSPRCKPRFAEPLAGATAPRRRKVLPPSAWDDLRHTFASPLLRSTRNPAWVQKALGDAGISAVLRH